MRATRSRAHRPHTRTDARAARAGRRPPWVAHALSVLAVLGAPVLRAGDAVTFTQEEVERILRLSPLPSPDPDETNAVADDPAAARLGQFLFFDARLSGDGRSSCATCHDPQRDWTDGRPLFEGRERGQRHTPSLWNVAYNRWFFWDGRADSLWAQALQPLENPKEMAGTRSALALRIATDPALRQAYEALFGPLPEPLVARRVPPAATPARAPGHPERVEWEQLGATEREAIQRVAVNAAKAIAAYERRLITRGAAFDVFVEGLREGDPVKAGALGPAARRGLKFFVGRGRCRLCHSGPNLSDGEFHDPGFALGAGSSDPGRVAAYALLLGDEFNARGRYSDDPRGPRARQLSALASQPHAHGEFKTPGLRNVARTAPYMHDGRFAGLRDVLGHYSTLDGRDPATLDERVLVPLRLSAEQTEDLLAFLESLTGAPLDPALLHPPDGPVAVPPRARP